ncbi:MAG: methyltransferase domain-containing protein [Gammaproteobacteria bacterium]|nr:methyltransferase domain-containing protein [Gammaproteobacteria bacterium]
MLRKVKPALRNTFPGLYEHWLRYAKARLPRKIEAYLRDTTPSHTLDEENFNRLQHAYTQWWLDYPFDYSSCWQRGFERAIHLLKLEKLQQAPRRILEAACGDGMTGYAFSNYGHEVTLVDAEDWRLGPAKQLPFIQCDLGERFAFPPEEFDFICSFNAFEHITHPDVAFDSLMRTCKTGGYIYLDFNPLYASPLGLHAFSFKMPYPQFLFDESLIQKKLRELGLHDLGRNMATLQPLNKWRLGEFRKLWERQDCKVLKYEETIDNSHINMIARFPQAFRGRGLVLEDVTVSGLRVLVEKT